MFAPCSFGIFHANAQRLRFGVFLSSLLCFPGMQQLGLTLGPRVLFLAGYEPWWHVFFLKPPIPEISNLR